MAKSVKISENVRKVTIPLHLLFVGSFVWLAMTGEWKRLFFAIPIWILVSGFGIAIGYHRLLAHSSFVTTPAIRRLLALCGVFAGQGSPVFWTATHRGLHHPFSDQDKDPHSPKRGLWHAFLGWQISFDRRDFNPRHAVDVIRDPFLKFISIHYHKVYWSLPILIFAIDWKFSLGSLIPALIAASHQENVVNTFCHLPGLGYRNFETSDDSNNIWILGVLFWGQALHNNHHRYPRRWDFGVRPFEFDPCSLVVPLLISKRAHQPDLVAEKSE